MIRISFFSLLLIATLGGPARSAAELDGFFQALYGGRIDNTNPAATELPVSEARLQLRTEHFGDAGEFFGRLDFLFSGADSVEYDWELREAYAKFQLGDKIDVKVGRQILTWGTGDLIFINDVFAKDYRSFFIGRDDQYLKAPQNAARVEYYNSLGDFSIVIIPRFEPNRLPTGRRLSYFNPFVQGIVGEGFFFDPPSPESDFRNSELAARFSRRLGNFRGSLYFYRGLYKNPLGAKMVASVPIPVYPRLHLFGGSLRGPVSGGILWLEGGYFDSRQDRNGIDPFMPNSSFSALIGFERQIATNLTVNGQWQVGYLNHYDTFKGEQQTAGALFIRDETRHLLTSRITKLLHQELVTLSTFIFYSPTDEDLYLRLSTEYKYSDEVILAFGGNLFAGKHEATDFGQLQKNDNLYLKVTYGF